MFCNDMAIFPIYAIMNYLFIYQPSDLSGIRLGSNDRLHIYIVSKYRNHGSRTEIVY